MSIAQSINIVELIQEFEKYPIIQDYLEFESLPYSKKQEIWDKWNKYYAGAKETPAYMLYKAQRTALEKNDYAKVKELGLEAKRMREAGADKTLDKPTERDPMEYYHDQQVLKYKGFKNDIQTKRVTDF